MRILIEKPDHPVFEPIIQGRVRRWSPTIRYLSQTEVHVYALAIAASVLLSFFPLLIVMMTLIRDVFHFTAAQHALELALRDYFPRDLGNAIIKNISKPAHARFQIWSVLLLLFTANGVFEPLEVALNRAWGVAKNRSYIRNQVLSLFMILLCGGLALGSIVLTAVNQGFVSEQYGAVPAWISLFIFRVTAVPVTILALILTYWLLPNRRVPVRRIVPVAAIVGAGIEGLKHLFLYSWPWLTRKLSNEYGDTFQYGVAIIFFSMLTSFLVLAGAEWSARGAAAKPEIEGVAVYTE